MAEKIKKEKWLRITLSTPRQLIDSLANFITELGAEGVFQEESAAATLNDFSGAAEGEELTAYLPFDGRVEDRIASLKDYIDSLSEIFPELARPGFSTEIITDQDWGEQWKKFFKPLRVSKNVVVKPTWERYTSTGHDIVVEIDPGMAFGTGQHASTRMCIEALEEIILKERTVEKWRVLDVGAGTGILGISCAKLGASEVVCLDIDPKAVEITRKNVAVNGVEKNVKAICLDVLMYDEKFNLIVANLTAGTLLSIHSHLVSLVEPGGYLVISGIINQDRKEIEGRYLTGDICLYGTTTEQEWVCYLLKKKGMGN